jgi:CDP-4-dehydro-6-deoxyglucose reductase, E3
LARKWEQENANFTYIPVLSEPLPIDDWQGRTGLVHKAVMDDMEDLSNYQVYACGAPAMVQTAYDDFIREHNMQEKNFFSDAFTPSTPVK